MLRIRLNTWEKRRDCQLWTLGGDVGPAVSQSIPQGLGWALGAVMNSRLETSLPVRLDSLPASRLGYGSLLTLPPASSSSIQ